MDSTEKRGDWDGLPNGTAAYRPEVDGLRAIAVGSVVLFHSGLSAIAGGYLGVDIFFAISGFLITGIILRALDKGSFTLAGFYLRRVRRIIPALTAMCLVTIPFAWALMLPDDLENFGQSVVATVLSANNVLLYVTSGYFALESLYKPLVHTWSLGVEEQYYLAVPLLLATAMKLGGRRAAGWILAVLTAASLGLAEWLRVADPNANFYLLPSRFWQLGLGGLAAMAQPVLLARVAQHGWRQALAALGLAMVLLPLFTFEEAMNLPGWPSLVPVSGTVLLLLFADGKGVGRVLTLPPMVGLGLISYSAYLWHQPVIAFVRIASLDQPSATTLLATIPLTLVLAWLSWRYVERPFRSPQRVPARPLLLLSGGLSAVAAGLGLLFAQTSGLYAMWPELAGRDAGFGARQNNSYVDGPFRFQGKAFTGQTREHNMLIVGDSFARDFINMGIESGALSGMSLSYDPVRPCEGEPEHLDALLRQAGSVVIGGGADAGTAPCVLAAIERYQRHGARVVVIGTKNFGFNNNAVMLLPEARRYAYRAKVLDEAVAANRAASRALPARHYVNLLALIDDGNGTVPVFTPERKFISQDRRHLTRAGAKWLGRIVFAQPQFAYLRPGCARQSACPPPGTPR